MCNAQNAEVGDLPPPPPLDPAAALFLDLDGTLVEIAPRPELVRVTPDLPGLLGRLAAARDGAVAVVSGRPLAQLDALLAPWRGAAAGLHGVERRRPDGGVAVSLAPAAAAALDRLRPQLADLAGGGAFLEDKRHSLALHYRGAPGRADALSRAAERLLATAGDALRLIRGNMVLEFQPAGADKGAAIAAFLGEPPFRGRCPVFVGDDRTDEDGFAEVARRGGLAIRVGAPGATAASHALPSAAAVRAWLAAAA